MNTESLNIPDGYKTRPISFDDLEQYVEFSHMVEQKHCGEQSATLKSVERDWKTPGFDLEKRSLLVLSSEAKIAAAVQVWDERTPPVKVYVDVEEHPDHEHLGLGEELLKWAEARARESMARCPDDVMVELLVGTANEYPRMKEVFANCGMEWRRREWRMAIRFTEDQKKPEIPQGIQIRAFQPDKEALVLYRVEEEGFEDHWGHVKEPDEQKGFERWKHWMMEDDRFDPELWFLAVEGEEIAGQCLCFFPERQDPTSAMVDSLSVLRNFRKRGIAQALLRYSFYQMQQRGMAGARLFVDSESLTGATRLYEKVGMKPDQTWDFYTKVLREGKNISTENLD